MSAKKNADEAPFFICAAHQVLNRSAGTSMISLIVPPKGQVSLVAKMLSKLLFYEKYVLCVES